MTTNDTLAVLHVHSNWSHDGHDSLSDLAAFANRERLRWVFLTDHAEDFTAARFQEYSAACRAASARETELIPGLEFRFEGYPGLHLLAIGLRHWIDPQTPEEFCRDGAIHAEFLVMAHPLLAKYRVPEAVLSRLHAVEVWNAQYNTRYVPDGQAIKLWQGARARWPHLVASAGTDQHRLRVEGKLRLAFFAVDSPFAALRSGHYRNLGITYSFDATKEWSRFELGVLARLRALVQTMKRWQRRLQ